MTGLHTNMGLRASIFFVNVITVVRKALTGARIVTSRPCTGSREDFAVVRTEGFDPWIGRTEKPNACICKYGVSRVLSYYFCASSGGAPLTGGIPEACDNTMPKD